MFRRLFLGASLTIDPAYAFYACLGFVATQHFAVYLSFDGYQPKREAAMTGFERAGYAQIQIYEAQRQIAAELAAFLAIVLRRSMRRGRA